MLGTKARAFAPLPPKSLADLVPPDHCSRPLARSLDLSFGRDRVRERDADPGRSSIDPVVFVKLQLVLCFEGLRSARQLPRVVADRLSRRWSRGDDLAEPLPDHSRLTRIRDRYGLEGCRRLFDAITEPCGRAGLVWGHALDSDATDVAANAALDSLPPRVAVAAHLARRGAATGADDRSAVGEDARTGTPDGTAGAASACGARRKSTSTPR